MSVKYFGSDALNKLIDLVKTALGLKADDSNVVHKTGDETVAGNKTFTGTTVFSNANNNTPVRIKGDTNLNDAYVGFYDRSNNNLGFVGVKSDNLPYFAYGNSDKRLALLEEVPTDTVEKIEDSDNCIKWVGGNGSYNYCLLATINILGTYADFPIVFKIFAREYAYTTLQIKFKNVNNNDPDLDFFTYDNSNNFRLYKSGTGTWQLYGIYASGKWGYYGIDRVIKGFSGVIDVTVNGTNVLSIPSGAVEPTAQNGLKIKSMRTSIITLSSLTWTQSSSGKYYTNTDSGLSSSDTIIGIFIADWGYLSSSIVIQPYAGGNDNKIRLMSNTNSFGSGHMAFIVLYT